MLHTQGNLYRKITDSIERTGFILSDSNEHYYTRAVCCLNGTGVWSVTACSLQGWMADHNGVIDTNQPSPPLLYRRATIEPTARRALISPPI